MGGGFEHIFEVAGPPTGAPEFVGDHFVDTIAKKHYISVGTSTVSDWVASNNDLHDAFKTFSTPLGTAPVATTEADTLIYRSTSGTVGITGNATTKEIELNTIDANINHDNLSGFQPSRHLLETEIDHDNLINGGGVGSHTAISSHMSSTLNPHNVSISQAIAADTGTDITTAQLETLTDNSQADSLHGHDHDALINFDQTEHFEQAEIDHAAILNIGLNTHSQIDASITLSSNHFINNDNPHGTTISEALSADVGTSASTADIEELTDGSATVLHTHAGAAPPDITMTLEDNLNPFLSSTTASYLLLASFEFPGTTLSGTPTDIRIYVSSAHAATGASFRVYDLTNLQTITELTGHVGAGFSMVTMGAIVNAPDAAPAVWEIQALRAAAPAQGQIGALRIVI